MLTNTETNLILSVFVNILNRHRDDPSINLRDTLRKELDYYVFQLLQNKYMGMFQDYWNSSTIPASGSTNRAIVLVERRKHPNINFVLKNILYYARGWSLTIICSNENIDFIKAILGSQIENVRLIPHFSGVGTFEEGKTEYNLLLQDLNFWRIFPEENILLVETDCYLRKPIPESILNYDYVASVWPWYPEKPGGGGISFRKRDAMIKICETYSVKEIAQDVYVSDAVEKLGMRFPKCSENVYFSEYIMDNAVCGYHQWWTFIDRCLAKDANILQECFNCARIE